MDARQQRGLQIAAVSRIEQKGENWLVPSCTGKSRYVVTLGEAPKCTCPDHEMRGAKCKHIYAVECVLERETTKNADGSTTVTESVTIKATKKTTYAQDWPAYNEAQTNEQDHFLELLRDLCAGVQTPREKGKAGRRPVPWPDAVFAMTFKVYSTVSCRRFMCDLRTARARGFIENLPCYNSIFNYLEDPAMSDVLTSLIVRASLPLRSVESDFAVDSTGFTSSRFLRWFDHKYGTVQVQHDWVKAHIMCGVKTNVVTAIEIHGRDTNDAPILPSLVDATAKNFSMQRVSADKGYSSKENHDIIAKHNAVPFIAFKANATGGVGGMFEKMFHYFSFKRDEFLKHYHQRSNVESTVNMVKAKFRDHVRSKTTTAMKNEVLCKVLCHNICCLISAIYELGIVPTFWPDEPAGPRFTLLPNNSDACPII